MSDVLQQVLDDPENQEHLREALTSLLRDDPVAFYKFIAMPRMQKLGQSVGEVEFVDRTPAEEAALMDRLTANNAEAAERDMQEFIHGKATPETVTVSS